MMFRPRESYDQRLLSSELTITPTPSRLRTIHDVFGNCVSVAEFAAPASELTFESSIRLEHTPIPAFMDVDGKVEIYTGAMPFAYSTEDLPDLLLSLARDSPTAEIDAWARQFVRTAGETSLHTLLREMTETIHRDFKYRLHHAKGAQTPTETLKLRSGSCRDYAVLMIDAVRSLGLAARFISGYIYSPRDQSGPARRGGGHTHAWVHVYLPVCGWVEFDPTNGIVGNSDLVRVAIARDPRQAVPLHGTWSGAPNDYLGMDVEVDVRSEEPTDMQQLAVSGVVSPE